MKFFRKFKYKLIRTVALPSIGVGLNKGERSTQYLYLFENGFGRRKVRSTYEPFERSHQAMEWLYG